MWEAVWEYSCYFIKISKGFSNNNFALDKAIIFSFNKLWMATNSYRDFNYRGTVIKLLGLLLIKNVFSKCFSC